MTDFVEYSKIELEVSDNVRVYIPTSEKIINWIKKNSKEIDGKNKGNLTFSYNQHTLKVKEEIFYND